MYYRLPSIICCLLVFTSSGKEVGGVLTRDTRWNAEEGPFYLTSDLLVARNVRLTVTAGTRVVVGASAGKDTAVTQYDDIDSHTVAIKIHGALICCGKSEKRITFAPDPGSTASPAWYGIILHEADEQFTEIAHADITGAYCGISLMQCSPPIRNSIIEHNHIGIRCTDNTSARVYNCAIVFNSAAGIRVTGANPCFMNNIIAFNRNIGVWCDGLVKVTCAFNCISGNSDGDFLECDPELGHLVKKNKRGDSIDVFKNLRCDPIFSGSIADSTARRQDISLPTEKHLVRDTTIAAILQSGRKKTNETCNPSPDGRYRLSKYSPCIDAGDPSGSFKDSDGSRNDMGIWGGPEFMNKK
ncbi:MAG: right-handed parallel beta-helix repeat-containing protein [Chitinispirillaceae bacterium]|nr:right-handed parallel beta-helix repeat-containing protein [Chitinispirillaceae bacterium]